MRRLSRAFCLAFALAATLAAHSAHAQTPPACAVKPDASWTPTEAAVWADICTGQPAALTAGQTLSGAFLQTLLTDPRFKITLTTAPIVITGAHVPDPVIIENANLQNKLYLQNTSFDAGLEIYDSTSTQGVVLQGDRFGGDLIIRRSSFSYLTVETTTGASVSIGNSVFAHNIQFSSVQFPAGFSIAGSTITGSLGIVPFAPGSNIFGPATILGTTVDGTTSITGSTFTGEFDGGESEFNGGFTIASSHFQDLAFFQDTDFTKTMAIMHASFARDLRFDTTNFKSDVNLTNVTINPSGKPCGPRDPCELFLKGANFAGNVEIDNSTINGDINADGADFSKSLIIGNDGAISHPLSLTMIDAAVAGNVNFIATAFDDLDLMQAHITGSLLFNDPPGAAWSRDAILRLAGANIGVLANATWDWPPYMNLAGMRFGLIGLQRPDLDKGGCINGLWSGWLRAAPYSPDPYLQLAKYLTDTGDQEAATCVEETNQTIALTTMGPLKKTVYWVYGQVAGFGYAPERAIIYAAGFILLGMLVLQASGQGRQYGMPVGFFYSFSQFIPLVSLDKKFDDVELTGYTRWYFYIHKILGWILAGFIAAALSGLTAKT